MRVVFLQNVPDIAKAGEIKEVSDGYARNYLIPRKLALAATPSAISLAETQRRIEAQSQAENEAQLVELANQLDGKEVNLKARAGAKERIYGSITTADIASQLESATGLIVDRKKMELTEPIRQLGSYEVSIRLTKDIVPRIKVTVVAEEASKDV